MNINQILLAAAMGESMPLNFDPLPTTEAASDANNFVCEFVGVANANETGVGGGLSGADLTLTRFGTVGAASSGWRTASANSGFSVTSAWVDTFLRNSTGFAILYHFKDMTTVGDLANLYGSSPTEFGVLIRATSTSVNTQFSGAGKFGISATAYTTGIADLLPVTGEFFILGSVDYTNNLSFVGISVSSVQPTKLSDFDFYSANISAQDPLASTMTLTAGLTGLVGRATTGGAAFSIKSVTARKGPSVSLA